MYGGLTNDFHLKKDNLCKYNIQCINSIDIKLNVCTLNTNDWFVTVGTSWTTSNFCKNQIKSMHSIQVTDL